MQFQVNPCDYGDLVVELAAKFPRSVLDILVERADTPVDEWWNFNDRPCPLLKIPDDVLVKWAGERPETRFIQLAEVIRPWGNTGGEQANASENKVATMQWTPTALKILREAPQPHEILRQYVHRVYPCGWSGSLASILEARLPLLATFGNDPDPALVQEAEAATAWLNEAIASERERETRESRKRDERFEW